MIAFSLNRSKRRKSKRAESLSLIPPRKNRKKASCARSARARPTTTARKFPFEVKVGDRVLVSKYGGTEIKLDGKEYKILGSDDLLAILE